MVQSHGSPGRVGTLCWCTSSMRQTSAEREMPAARQSALKPALAASVQFRIRTAVPSVQRSTCVASVLHSSRGKCTLHRNSRLVTGHYQTVCKVHMRPVFRQRAQMHPVACGSMKLILTYMRVGNIHCKQTLQTAGIARLLRHCNM